MQCQRRMEFLTKDHTFLWPNVRLFSVDIIVNERVCMLGVLVVAAIMFVVMSNVDSHCSVSVRKPSLFRKDPSICPESLVFWQEHDDPWWRRLFWRWSCLCREWTLLYDRRERLVSLPWVYQVSFARVWLAGLFDDTGVLAAWLWVGL